MNRYVISVICLLVGFSAGAAVGIYVHELGHQAACLNLGYKSGGITLDVLESSHMCMFHDRVSDAEILVVLAAGGGLATAVFGAALASFWLLVRMSRAMRLDGFALYFILAGLVSQLINLVMEAGFNASYTEATRTLGATCALVLVCCVWYSKLPRSPDRRWLGRIRRPL